MRTGKSLFWAMMSGLCSIWSEQALFVPPPRKIESWLAKNILKMETLRLKNAMITFIDVGNDEMSVKIIGELSTYQRTVKKYHLPEMLSAISVNYQSDRPGYACIFTPNAKYHIQWATAYDVATGKTLTREGYEELKTVPHERVIDGTDTAVYALKRPITFKRIVYPKFASGSQIHLRLEGQRRGPIIVLEDGKLFSMMDEAYTADAITAIYGYEKGFFTPPEGMRFVFSM